MYLAFVVVLRHRCDFKQYVYWVEGRNTCSAHMNPRVFFRNQEKVMLTSGRHACKKQWSIDYCNIVSDMISCLQQYYSGTKKETVWHGQPYSYITRSPKFCIFKNKNQKLSPNTVSVENE